MNPLLKLVLDLGPLIVFFVANARFGIFVGTGIFMAAMLVTLVAGIIIEKKVSPMSLVTAALVLVFGGLTLWLENDIFIKVKPTILYAMFAVVLAGGLYFRRLFLKILLSSTLNISETAWRTLTWRFAGFFLVLAIANEIAWRSLSTDMWLASKMWGFLPATLLFSLAQAPFISRHQVDETAP